MEHKGNVGHRVRLLAAFGFVSDGYDVVQSRGHVRHCPTHESSARSEASAFATDLDVLGFWQLASRKCPSNTRAWRSAL